MGVTGCPTATRWPRAGTFRMGRCGGAGRRMEWGAADGLQVHGAKDVGLGLTHMGARFYDFYIGRWISADTIVPEPTNAQAWNRYSYARNSPLMSIDPSGHITEEESEEAQVMAKELCEVYGICDIQDWGWASGGGIEIWFAGTWQLHQVSALLDTAKYAASLEERFQAGELSSLELLTQLVDYRAGIGSMETFIDDISTIVLGARGFQGVYGPPLHLTKWEPLGLDDSGFREYFQDNSPQVRHFWYYVHVAYTTGSKELTTLGNDLHESKIPVIAAVA